MDCLFCKIVTKTLQSGIVYEDDQVLAFEDISPQAPVHILVIPRRHIPTLGDCTEKETALIGKLILVAKELAQGRGVADAGYRIVINCNRGAGQSVFHLHAHLLAGREFTWPPG